MSDNQKECKCGSEKTTCDAVNKEQINIPDKGKLILNQIKVEACQEVDKTAKEKAKEKYKKKLIQLKAAQQVVSNIKLELQELELAIYQEFSDVE